MGELAVRIELTGEQLERLRSLVDHQNMMADGDMRDANLSDAERQRAGEAYEDTSELLDSLYNASE